MEKCILYRKLKTDGALPRPSHYFVLKNDSVELFPIGCKQKEPIEQLKRSGSPFTTPTVLNFLLSSVELLSRRTKYRIFCVQSTIVKCIRYYKRATLMTSWRKAICAIDKCNNDVFRLLLHTISRITVRWKLHASLALNVALNEDPGRFICPNKRKGRRL